MELLEIVAEVPRSWVRRIEVEIEAAVERTAEGKIEARVCSGK